MFDFRFAQRGRFAPSPEDFERMERYRRLWLYYAPYDGDPYHGGAEGATLADMRGLPAYISSIFNYVPFVVNADLHLLHSGFALEYFDIEGARRAQMRDFLASLNFEEVMREALLSALVCGDAFVKVIFDPNAESGIRLVVLDAASVFPRLDEHDFTTVRQMLISYSYRDADGLLHKRDELWEGGAVEVRLDGRRIDEQCGVHPLGRFPIVHFACNRIPGEYFGRPTHLDIIGDIDRLNTAAGAVFETFKYYGSPKLILKGFAAPDLELDPDIRQFWQIPSGECEISFLEWKNASGLVDEILKLDMVVRRKMPEFVLDPVSQRSYPASGLAVSLQLSLLDAKIQSLWSSFRSVAEELALLAGRMAGINFNRCDLGFTNGLAPISGKVISGSEVGTDGQGGAQ